MSEHASGTDLERAITLVEDAIRRLGLDPVEANIPGDHATRAYALRRGSARIVVAIHANQSGGGTLRVLAPCVRIGEGDPVALFRHVLEMNARELVGAAFGVFGDEVVVVTERSVEDLDASEVDGAIRTVGRVADRHDDSLAARFGVVRSSDA